MTVLTGLPGLDLVLGGGIEAFSRFGDRPPAATIVVRGPPGAGKSILALTIAWGLATTGDVALGCVEILPTEVRKQLAPFTKLGPRVAVRQSSGWDNKLGRRVFAELLDLPAERPASALEDQVARLLTDLRLIGASPGVIVIDSLGDGYSLGTKAPRMLVDGMCKLAAKEGVVAIFVEETTTSKPSHWCFAADVVLELSGTTGLSTQPARRGRLVVAKNRFGRTDPGIHRLVFDPQGARVLPNPPAYLAGVLRGDPSTVIPSATVAAPWGVPELDSQGAKWPTAPLVTAVHGADAGAVRAWATWVGSSTARTLKVEFGAFFGDMRGSLLMGNPFLDGHVVVDSVIKKMNDDPSFGRVVIGDFRSLRTFRHAREIRRGIRVVSELLRQQGIPVVLFETGTPRIVHNVVALGGGPMVPGETGADEPLIVDGVDVVLELRAQWQPAGGKTAYVRATNLRSGHTIDIPRGLGWQPWPSNAQ